MNLVTGGLVFQSGVTTGSRMRRGLSEEWVRDAFAFKGLLPGERRLGCPRGPPGTGRRMRRSKTGQQNEAFPGKHERPGGNSEGRRAAGTQAGKTAKAMQTHLFVGLHAP